MQQLSNLRDFIRSQFQFAIHLNPEFKFSEEDLLAAKSILGEDIEFLRPDSRELLAQSFACLIASVKAYKSLLWDWDERSFLGKGQSWRDYHSMIADICRVLHSFSYGEGQELEFGGQTFEITEVIFKGERKNDSIKISGPILSLIRAMFDSFNSVCLSNNSSLMKSYSEDLYEEYELFKMQKSFLAPEKETFSGYLVEMREAKRLDQAKNNYRNTVAFQVHMAIKAQSELQSDAAIPAYHKRIIGRLLEEVGMIEYFGHHSDSQVANFIVRGNPKQLGAN
jgi:hypothetical protein